MARRKRNQKKADETLVDIVEVRDSAQGFIDENQKLIFGALVVLVLAIGGVFAYNNFYKKPRQAEAEEQMFRAQEQFERDSFALALTNPGGGYLGFLDIIEQYGATPAGNSSRYYAGVSYLNLGRYEAAIDYLDQFDAEGQVLPIMKYGAMGDAYSEMQDFDNAMKYYQRAADAKENDFLTPYYLKKIGMLHERNGNFAEAEKAYKEILAKYPESPVGRDIEKYITRVEAKG